MCRWSGGDTTWFLPVVLCTLVIISFTTADDDQSGNLFSSTSPKIQILEIGKSWENITGKVGAPEKGVNSIYSSKGDDLFLRCTANYPIQWNINGIINPPEVVKILQPKRNIKDNIFEIQINIFFLDAENYVNLVAAATIACVQVGNAGIRDEIAVFVKGNNGKSLLTPGDKILEGEVKVLPCLTTNPTKSSSPGLYLKGQTEKQVKDVVYSAAEGFRLISSGRNFFPGGTYICRQDRQSVTITVIEKLAITVDGQFAPVSDTLRRFSDEAIEFQCSSDTKPVKLIFDRIDETVVTFTTDLEKSKVAKLAPATTFPLQNSILQGKAACIAEGQQLIKEWSWEFVEPPQLHLDNLEGEADCLSPLSPKLVQTVRCKNAMDCDFMRKSCLRNVTSCNFKKQKQFFANVDTYCWVAELGKGVPCVSVPFSHLNGVVQCGILGLERHWEFFISLDYIRYSHWEDAPLRELVRIEEISENEGNTDDSIPTQIVCTASAYLFADSIAFEIEYKNGSRSVVVQDDNNNLLKKQHSNKSSRQILELYVKATLDKTRIPKDAVAVNCLAPFWNTTNILKTTKFLGTGPRRMAASISKLETPNYLQETSKPQELQETFYIGEKNKRLNCSVGESRLDLSRLPVPSWFYKGVGGESKWKNATQVYPELKIYTDKQTGEDYLEFPRVEKKHAGEYRCALFSLEGSNDNNLDGNNRVLTMYRLQVSAEPLPTTTTVYVGLTILVLVIVGLAIAGFAVFVQKRNT